MKKIKAILRDISYFFKGFSTETGSYHDKSIDFRCTFYLGEIFDDSAWKFSLILFVLGISLQKNDQSSIKTELSFVIPFYKVYSITFWHENYLRKMEENALWDISHRIKKWATGNDNIYTDGRTGIVDYSVKCKSAFDIKIDTDKSCKSLRDDLKNLEL